VIDNLCKIGYLKRIPSGASVEMSLMDGTCQVVNAECQESVSGARSSSAGPKAGAFTTTLWTAVLRAGHGTEAEAGRALEELCRKYWYPIYACVRRHGADSHEAEDLTQAFFAFLLEKEVFKKADRQRGKFRSFLLAALMNFLHDEWDKRQTLKRGQCRIISLDAMAAEERLSLEPVELLTPIRSFERGWARTLLEHALHRLKQEYAGAVKAKLFAKLEPALTGEVTAGSYADWATALGMSTGAVKVALHRLRRRYGELLRTEIADTVASPAEVEEEIRQLFAVIAA